VKAGPGGLRGQLLLELELGALGLEERLLDTPQVLRRPRRGQAVRGEFCEQRGWVGDVGEDNLGEGEVRQKT